ncbi:MAG: glutathione S-transferase [Gammaproteobacteria bacterium]|jgi:glutathione S-transferase
MIRLHHGWESRSTRTLALLHELELPFELVVHSFSQRLYTDDYRKLSPAGRVPALEDANMVLFETGAITEYLVETYADKGLGRAVGNPERYEYLQWLHFAETIGQHIASLTQQHVVLREDWMKSRSVMKYEKMRLDRCLSAVDAQLAGRDYLLASGFSAIDTNLGYSLYAAKFFSHLEAFDNLTGYFERLFSRPSFQKALPPDGAERLYHQTFYKVPDA